MSKKNFKLDLSNITKLKDLVSVLGMMNFHYITDTSIPDPTFNKFKKMGIIGEEIESADVKCDICSHMFKSIAVNEKVDCPNCGNKTYIESEEEE